MPWGFGFSTGERYPGGLSQWRSRLSPHSGKGGLVWRKSPPRVSAPYEVVLESWYFLQDFCSFQVVLAIWEEIGSGFILLELLDLSQKEVPPQWEMGLFSTWAAKCRPSLACGHQKLVYLSASFPKHPLKAQRVWFLQLWSVIPLWKRIIVVILMGWMAESRAVWGV